MFRKRLIIFVIIKKEGYWPRCWYPICSFRCKNPLRSWETENMQTNSCKLFHYLPNHYRRKFFFLISLKPTWTVSFFVNNIFVYFYVILAYPAVCNRSRLRAIQSWTHFFLNSPHVETAPEVKGQRLILVGRLFKDYKHDCRYTDDTDCIEHPKET